MMNVAIVGMGCRFPGGVHNPLEYWRFLTGKGDGITEVPSDRWNLDLFYDSDPDAPGRMYTRHGGFLTDSLWDFDPEFFGISPREASIMDPQQRLILEVAWEALDDAGIAARVGGRDVGVYVGGFMNDNQVRRHLPTARTAINSHTPTSGTFTMLSNRLSYVLDLRGPSMTIDTACSSSLVAIHEASQAVSRGECEVAIAGGVNVMLHPETSVSMCKGRFLAPDGRCKSFDAAADGYARGEGAGMIVLKPVNAALRDGDRIYAVIRGTGSNQDGRTSGITVPNPDAQETLARRVCAEAGLEPCEIGYVEAHGTGTAVGDPVEMGALGKALGAVPGRTEPLVVGSVKAAIGHLEAAAGVAGVMKAALIIYHRTIIPQAWLRSLNPAIPFAELNLRVPTEVEPFPAGYTQAVVAVNGFGYGGSNAHVVLGEAPPPQPLSPRRPPVRVFPVSGGTEAAARTIAGEIGTLVAGSGDVDLICAAAWTRRAHHQFRTAAAYRDARDLAAQLTAFAVGSGKNAGRTIVAKGTRPVFVFSGMGPQWWHMGRNLLRADGVFARTAREIDAVFTDLAGWSVVEELLRDEKQSRVTRAEVAQPANFLVQVCLVAELEALGVRPAAVVGHSVGEVAAAYVSGALSLRDALLVSYHRARLQATTAGSGGMLAVGLPAAEALQWIPAQSELCVAAVNGRSSVTLAGDSGSLERLRVRLVEAGIFARTLTVDVPYHSPLMDPILSDLESVLGGVQPMPPSLALYSTVTGAEVTDASWGAAYWRDNVRQPVRFDIAVGALIEGGHRVFLEVGPHPVLSGNIRDMLVGAGETGTSIPTLVRDQDDESSLLRAVGDLYVAGCLDAPETPGVNGGPAPHVELPAYPWQRTRLWSEESAVTRLCRGTSGTRPLLGERMDVRAAEWEVELSTTRLPWLRDHVVDGLVLLPGAAYLDAALSAAAELTDRQSLAMESVRFIAPLVIDEHDVPVLRLAVDESTSRFSVRSRTATGTDWTVNVTGRLVDGHVEPCSATTVTEAETRPVTGDELYAELSRSGLQYGPAFRRVIEARVGGDTVAATVDASSTTDNGHLAHPAVTDAALQCVAALLSRPRAAAGGAVVPARVRAVRRFAPLPPTVTVMARRRPETGLHADVVLCDLDGQVVLELTDVEFSSVSPPVPAIAELDRLFYQTVWEPRASRDQQPIAVHRAQELAVVVDLGAESSARAGAIVEAHPRAHHVPLGPLNGSAAASRVAEIVREGLSDPRVDRVLVIVVAGRWETDDQTSIGVDAIAGLVATARSVKNVLDEFRRQDPALEPTSAVDPSRADAVRGVVVTERAFRLPEDQHEPDLAHAALVGARRSLRNEQPSLRWRLVDLEPDSAFGEVQAELLCGGAYEDDDADEVCLRPGARMVPRMRKSLASHLQRFAENVPLADAEAESFELEVPQSGLLQDLAMRSCKRVAPGAGEVELRVEVVGLNYKDTMKILGLLTAEDLRGTYFGTSVGMEGFGVVTRVGPDVTDVIPGDRMWVLVRDMFRRYVTMPINGGFLGRAPHGTRPEHCGSMVPLLTARYGLRYAAGVSAGETVLVHGAAGGTGLAAVQVARSLGARVIGSAGTDVRRKFVLAAGADEVVNSRSLNFVDDVLRMTDGRGVDVVFNSAPGEVLRQNLRVAAEFGRIIEIGKADIYGDGVIDLRPFDRNLSFIAVDTDRMFEFRPELFKGIAREVLDRLDNGEYRSLPATAYPLSQLSEAFEAVARSRHVGRVAVTLGTTARVRPRRPEFPIRGDATYLITGGFGAFGMATARWLVSRGARHLVLVGRRGATTSAAQKQLQAFEAAGIEIVQEFADVANHDEVQALVRKVVDTMPSLRGVFHAAGVAEDRPLAEITVDSLRRVMNPKTRGALNLHAVLDDVGADLDAFVLYSSMSALLGPVPQIAYAGANAVLDALAVLRQAQGKPALSVNWGALGGGGMAEASEEVERYLALLGFRPLDMDLATAMLRECLSLGGEVVEAGVADLDWAKWASAHPASAPSARFSEQIAAERAGGSGAAALRQELLRLPAEQRGEVLTFVLAEQLAEVLGIPADAVDLATPLPEQGLDSLMGVEFSARVYVTLGIEMSVLEFSRGIGLSGIADRLAAQMSGGEASSAPSPASGAKLMLWQGSASEPGTGDGQSEVDDAQAGFGIKVG